MAQYELRFAEGHGFRSDPDPFSFHSQNDKLAMQRVAKTLNTTLPLTRRKLYNAGAVVLMRGKTRVFPKRKK